MVTLLLIHIGIVLIAACVATRGILIPSDCNFCLLERVLGVTVCATFGGVGVFPSSEARDKMMSAVNYVFSLLFLLCKYLPISKELGKKYRPLNNSVCHVSQSPYLTPKYYARTRSIYCTR